MGTVLITGAARGLGLDFVKQYAAKGWKVHACARKPEALKDVEGDIHAHSLEVTDYAAVKALAEKLSGEAIDVLICNAGISAGREQGLGAIEPTDWRQVFEVNTLAPLMMAGAFVDHVARSKDRKLVAVSSRMGSVGENNGGSYAYRASKTALNMEWSCIAKDVAGKGVTCVVLHPGWVQTDMGGKNATLTIDQSVPAMVKVIDGITKADNGRFINYDGGAIPWWLSPTSMLLSEEQILIRDTARAFAQEQVLPNVRAWEAAGEIPRPLLQEMGRLGFMGMCVPEEWGGAGSDMISYVLALEEIAAADGGLSTVMSVNNSPDCAALLGYGSPEQKERWLKPLARGEMLGAFCLTEPHAGSDASNLKTRAERRGNGWVLNGVKQFITSGRTADVALVFAVTDPTNPKRGISCFIVPTKTPGYRVASVEKKLGQKSSDTCQIAFEDCVVGADALLGTEGDGYRVALANLEAGRIGIAAQAVGMARAAFEAARSYANERVAFGTAIANHQAVQFRLADMATKITVARQMVLHAATLRAAARPCLTEAAMAKLYASEMAEEVCSAAIQVHGGYGYVSDYLVEKIWRDVRVCQIYEGTSDVQRILIGRGLGSL